MPIYLWCGTSFYALKCSETNWARNAIKVTTTTMYWADPAPAPGPAPAGEPGDTHWNRWMARWPARSIDGWMDGCQPGQTKCTEKRNDRQTLGKKYIFQ